MLNNKIRFKFTLGYKGKPGKGHTIVDDMWTLEMIELFLSTIFTT